MAAFSTASWLPQSNQFLRPKQWDVWHFRQGCCPHSMYPPESCPFLWFNPHRKGVDEGRKNLNPPRKAFDLKQRGLNRPRKAFDLKRRHFNRPRKVLDGDHSAIDVDVLGFKGNHITIDGNHTAIDGNHRPINGNHRGFN